MTSSPLLILILAAGMGTRMKSSQPKVMHKIGNKPMIGHVLELGVALKADATAVVVGPDMEVVADYAKTVVTDARDFLQTERLGTAHAVLSARDVLQNRDGHVLVLYGDTPLLTSEALNKLLSKLEEGAHVGVLGFEAEDPTGYGRLLLDGCGELAAIREEKDAIDDERAINFCNSGVMGFQASFLLSLLDQIGNDNANGEYYLTDAIEIARAQGLKTVAAKCKEEDVLGVNDRVQLSIAEEIFQSRMRVSAQRAGATLIAPDTVFFSADTVIGQDVVIEPHVVFGPNVVIQDRVRIYGFSHIEGANIGEEALVGPYARLRPGAEIGEGAKVGNFVEVKKSAIATGAKVNHLTYIGDSEIGKNANIGAGTITCNYDGYFKHKTIIGENCFVGSNSSLIAPVRIGDGAFIGSGSVISDNVPDHALAITRADKRHYEGWAAKYHRSQARKKAAAKS